MKTSTAKKIRLDKHAAAFRILVKPHVNAAALCKNVMKRIKKISISAQVFLALITVILIMAAIFSPYGFYTNVTSIRHSIDERLLVAANGVREIIPENYIEKLRAGQISDAQYMALRAKLVDFKNRIGVTYLYVLVCGDDGVIRFALDQDEKALAPYKNPTDETKKIFETHKAVGGEAEDADYGIISRTVMLPFKTKSGEFYAIGADLNVAQMYPMIFASIRDFIFLLSLGIFLVFLVTMVLTKRISMPIRMLSEFMKSLTNSNFSPELKIEDYLPRAMMKTNELSMLASDIDKMRSKLHEYIANLKIEMAARNVAETELKVAGGIQESFLPGTHAETDAVSVRAFMKPAKQAGGDLYDFFELPDGRMCFAIGDTSGKGMPAALFMARAMTLIRSAAVIASSLKDMVFFINNMLSESNESCTFITFFICAFDPKTGNIEFVNCGHNPPYIRRADAQTRILAPKTNRVLGVFGSVEFEAENMRLERGDTLICYTDGVTEAEASDGSFYGDERLAELLNALPADASEAKIVKTVADSVFEFERGAEQSDDVTVMAIRRK